ncbi:MAG: hypothetical protein Q9225_006149 [Loekoesia sp. 1 TL-2023]
MSGNASLEERFISLGMMISKAKQGRATNTEAPANTEPDTNLDSPAARSPKQADNIMRHLLSILNRPKGDPDRAATTLTVSSAPSQLVPPTHIPEYEPQLDNYYIKVIL